MQTVIIYDTFTSNGNTGQIARAIARGVGSLGDVRVLSVAEAIPSLPEPLDLLLVGGPTQRHGLSPGLRGFIERLPARSLPGVKAASFDTRFRMASWITGSAAKSVAGRLREAGSKMVAPPESFFVEREGKGAPAQAVHLLPGELERAEAWGRAVATAAVKPS